MQIVRQGVVKRVRAMKHMTMNMREKTVHEVVRVSFSNVFNEDAERVRERRARHPPSYLIDYVLFADEQAIDSEINSIEKNKTWSLSELPTGAKRISVKWQGWRLRMIIALTTQKGWKIFQLNVKSAFLYGELSEEVYIEQPRGYETIGREQLVYKLHKAFRNEAHFIKDRLQKCDSEKTLFTKKNEVGKIIIVNIYVDLIFTDNDKDIMCDFKRFMPREFDMIDLRSIRFFLGIEVLQRTDGIFIYQKIYALEILRRFGMLESNEVSSPIIPGFNINKDENETTMDETYLKQLVGRLMYLTVTRPYMMFVTGLISRFMARPIELHLHAAKRVLRYLKGTVNYCIHYKKGGDDGLFVFTDSDYARDVEDRKSTSG
uniref:Reverse transcriptase Ty1/copia-type domain-containing protein n=1 Tax=Salix viminalis TaxID=40686 RepID=A0A6N2M2Z6_SALVM